MAELPKQITILGLTYTITRSVEDNERWGATSPTRQEIVFIGELSAERERETMLHELIHAVGDGLKAGLTEQQVHILARGLWSVLAGNPKLARWLMATANGK